MGHSRQDSLWHTRPDNYVKTDKTLDGKITLGHCRLHSYIRHNLNDRVHGTVTLNTVDMMLHQDTVNGRVPLGHSRWDSNNNTQ